MRAYSLDVRHRVVTAGERGVAVEEVARLFGLSRATINRYQKRQREVADLRPGRSPGRPRQIGPAVEPALARQLEAVPEATLEQHCRQWADEQGGVISLATMRRASGRVGWTRKKSQWRPVSATRRPANSGATTLSSSI